MIDGYLTLETGEVFKGELLGDISDICGEVVFNTSMTGYQEIMTDPSYAGQIVLFTYPLIGNYGVNNIDNESGKSHVKAIITNELCSHPSHFALTNTLENVLQEQHIPCLTNVDTRELVKIIRKKGTVTGVISTEKARHVPSVNDAILVDLVAIKDVRTYENKGPHIIIMDFGVKKSILKYLLNSHCKVTIVPYDYPLEKIYALKPDGVVISNGPGDPLTVSNELEKIKAITLNFPTLGICLGHQLIALAYGAQTKKLHFGHRGGNHPVKDVKTGKVYITSQNHGYVVIDQTIDENQFLVTFKHVNDGTIEGLEHRHLPIITVQFHPEANPGPMDTEYIFDKYINLLKQKVGVMQYAFQ